MFANGYVGTAEDANRIRRQEKEREKQRKKYEQAAAAKHEQAAAAGLKQFAATSSEALEHAFKNETIGLVSKADFVKKRTTLQDRLEEEQRRKQEAEEAALAAEKERKRRQQLNLRAGKLSFSAGDDEEAEADAEDDAPAAAPAVPVFRLPRPASTDRDAGGSAAAAAAAANGAADGSPAQAADGRSSSPPAEAAQQAGEPAGGAGSAEGRARPSPSPEPDAERAKKIGKNPDVVTDFLPDRDRARMEAEMRAQLKKEWQAQQDKVRSEPLAIVYSYWDGAGHRREIRVKKGDTIGGFLKAVKEQLVPDFRELRHVSVDNLLYVKEDIILPHHHTFYELIINKARGKSGPLFDFGVHEDIRVMNDASREKNESHAGKVVERHWYDRNKHIFPASRWEIYDPEKKYDTYTIYGD